MRLLKASVMVVSLLTLTTNPAAAQPLYPLISGWEQWFRVESEVSIRHGHPVVSGTVWNTSSWNARRIQLLVEALDANGKPVSQRVVWLGPDLPSGERVYFEVPTSTSAPVPTSYRVSVFAFDSGRGRRG